MVLVENVDNVVNDMKKGCGRVRRIFSNFLEERFIWISRKYKAGGKINKNNITTTTQDENYVKIYINTKLSVEDTLLVFCTNLILFAFNRNFW